MFNEFVIKNTRKKCYNCCKIYTEDFLVKKLENSNINLCLDCREQKIISWTNIRNLYQRKCDLCSKDIISIYSKKAKFPVYCDECW